MRTLNPPSSASGYLWRAAVIALAYFAGSQLSGMLIGSIGLPWPDAPTDAPLELRLLLDLASSVLLATCLVPLAAGLSGSTARRWLILAAFFYVSYGVNNQDFVRVLTEEAVKAGAELKTSTTVIDLVREGDADRGGGYRAGCANQGTTHLCR